MKAWRQWRAVEAWCQRGAKKDWRSARYREVKEKYAKPIEKGAMFPSFPDESRKEFLIEAYKKHSAELAAIEDRLNKFLLVILGVFGAGAVAVPNMRLTHFTAGVLGLVMLSLTGLGLKYTAEIHGSRKEVRYLLVRCEIAMGFYTPRAPLYTCAELEYPTKGGFLSGVHMAIIAVAAIGLIVLIISQADQPRAAHPDSGERFMNRPF